MQAGAHLSELPQSTQRASPRKRRQSAKQTCDRTVRSKWGAWCANVWGMVHLPRTELTVSATRADLSALRAGNRTSKSEANGERQKMVWAWRTSRRSCRPLRSPLRPTTGSAPNSSRRSRRPRAAAAQRTAGVAAGTVRRPASATAEGGAALSCSEAPVSTAEPRPPAYQRRASPRAARPRLRAKAGAPSLHRFGQALRETLHSVLTRFPGHFSLAGVFGGIYCILKRK